MHRNRPGPGPETNTKAGFSLNWDGSSYCWSSNLNLKYIKEWHDHASTWQRTGNNKLQPSRVLVSLQILMAPEAANGAFQFINIWNHFYSYVHKENPIPMQQSRPPSFFSQVCRLATTSTHTVTIIFSFLSARHSIQHQQRSPPPKQWYNLIHHCLSILHHLIIYLPLA